MRVAGSNGGGDSGQSMILDIEMRQSYRHTLGRSTPFFDGLDRGVVRATRCTACQSSFLPPKSHCPRDRNETTWYELPGTGTVVAATRVHSPPPFGGIEAPYVLAVIRLDGVDGGLTHRITGDSVPDAGAKVVARFGDGAGPDGEPLHPLLTLSFELAEEAP